MLTPAFGNGAEEDRGRAAAGATGAVRDDARRLKARREADRAR